MENVVVVVVKLMYKMHFILHKMYRHTIWGAIDFGEKETSYKYVQIGSNKFSSESLEAEAPI
jgi:hypothetical protein